MVLKMLCVEPIYPQYSGVLESCLALRYWFFGVLGSESVNESTGILFRSATQKISCCLKLLDKIRYVHSVLYDGTHG